MNSANIAALRPRSDTNTPGARWERATPRLREQYVSAALRASTRAPGCELGQ
ncbi:hypothetical protein [Rhodococcus wratislaviensis]|nr:hypothetical protein [Rhodococcus wratislaviensis]